MSGPDGGAVGLYGGTFDPVHCGHLQLASAALRALPLECVIWSPAGQPPHRAPTGASAADRLAMVERAISGDSRFVLDAGEATSEQTSYTVSTLERLRRRYGPRRSLVLLLGGDAFAAFSTWHRWRDILGLAHLAVASRAGQSDGVADPALPERLAREVRGRCVDRQRFADALAEAPAGMIAAFPMPPVDVSATRLRAALAADDGSGCHANLLPSLVLDYIRSHRLYRPGGADHQEPCRT